jgi:hypothetical protein
VPNKKLKKNSKSTLIFCDKKNVKTYFWEKIKIKKALSNSKNSVSKCDPKLAFAQKEGKKYIYISRCNQVG